MARLIVVYWRDIPAQVIGRSGRERVRRQLHPRFAEAIDTAAMRAGKGGSEAYLEAWRRESQPCAGDLPTAVEELAARLEAELPEERLRALARAGGVAGPADD